MLGRLLLIFTLVPLIELAILIRLGELIGFWATFGLVIATGALGAILARAQGIRVLRSMQAELNVGQVPAARLVDGFLVLVGGILLLTPGLLTDVVGFSLLLPFTRNRLKEGLRRRFEHMIRSGQVSMITLIR